MYFSCSWRTTKMASVVPLPCYQAQSRTTSRRCSPSRRCRSLVSVPAASWSDLWVWDIDNCHARPRASHLPFYRFRIKLSSQSNGITPQLKTASISCLASSTPSSLTAQFQHFSFDARWSSSLAYRISFCWVLCGSGLQTHWEGGQQLGELRELVAWPLKFDIEQPGVGLTPGAGEPWRPPPPKLQVSAVTWPRSRFNTSGPDPLGFDWEGLAASRGTAGGRSGLPPLK